MREVTRTQARRTTKSEPKKKLRVAAYCRVSTDSDEQETASMITQKYGIE